MTILDFKAYLALGQGLYYAVTGVWPLVNMESFEKVTGPKVDGWLVKTVGVLVAVIGGVLGVAGWRRTFPLEIPLLAGGSAAGLAAIDLVYALRRRISPIYLADAAAELSLVAAWALNLALPSRSPATPAGSPSRFES